MEGSVAPSVVASPPPDTSPLPQPPSNAEYFKHKNHLQEYTQRYSIAMPLYQTINEGFSHAPKFRSTVIVDGITFKSPNIFAHRKAAEQDVARVALESLSTSVLHEGSTSFHMDAVLCKSILNEYAVKKKLPLPSYSNSQTDGVFPTFVSTVVFNEKTYTGPSGKSKKEAEQLGARTVIESILGESSARALMIKIIRAKDKLFDAKLKVEGAGESVAITVPSDGKPSNNPEDISGKGTDVQFLLANNMLPNMTHAEVIPGHQTVPRLSSTTVPCLQQIQHIRMVPQVYTYEAAPVGSFVPLPGQMQGGQSATDGSIGIAYEVKKKQKRKKKKEESQKKKTRLEVQSESIPAA